MADEKSLGQKILGLFFDGTVEDAKKYVTEDVLKPTARRTLHDAVVGGIEAIFSGHGNNAPNVSGNPSYKNGKAYNEIPFRGRQPEQKSTGFSNVAFPTWEKANETLINMLEEIGRYGHTTVATLYESAGTDYDSQYNKWGWENLNGVTIKTTPNGFFLDLPKPIPLRRL